MTGIPSYFSAAVQIKIDFGIINERRYGRHKHNKIL
jgi:hypothetical protein